MLHARRPRRLAGPAFIFAAWALWLSFPYLAFGPASYVKVHDCGDSLLPALLSVARGGESWWFASGVCGADRLASALAGHLDLPLFLLLPGWLAYGLLIWTMRFLAGWSAFRLLADDLRLDPFPSFCGGILYALFPQSALNYSWNGFNIGEGPLLAAVPFCLWILHRADRLRPLAGAACAAGLGALCALASSYALTVFSLPCVFLWCVFVAPLRRPNRLRLPTAFSLGWIAGASPFLWAGLLNAPLSHRAAWPVFRPLPGGGRIRPAFAYGLLRDNAAPLAVAAIAAVRARDRRLTVPVVYVLAVLLLVLVYRMVRAALLPYLAFLSGFQFDRLYLLIPFFAMVGGSAGLHLIGCGDALPGARRGFHPLLRRLPVFLFAALVVAQSASICRGVLRERRRGSTFAALYLRPEIRRLAERRDAGDPFRIATVGNSLFHPSCAWAYGLESADGYLTLYPKRYHDFWGQVIAPLAGADESRRIYFHTWGSRAYLFNPTGGFPAGGTVPFRHYYDLDLLSLANVRYVISPIALQDDDLVPLPRNVEDGAPLRVYENRLALPRFFLARNVKVCGGTEDLLRAVREAGREKLATTAFVERGACPGLPEAGGGGVEVRRYSADRIDLHTTAAAPSLLVILNSFSPFWTARVDGVPAPVVPVDHAFQGVVVGAGTREVTLDYSPSYAHLSRRCVARLRGTPR